MVEWREDFEKRRRFEAARRLVYLHPLVANRCRSFQMKSIHAVENINNNNVDNEEHKNLSSLANIKMCKLNLKTKSAPLCSGKFIKQQSEHTDHPSKTPSGQGRSFSSLDCKLSTSSMMTTHNFFPSIKTCSNDTKNKCFLINNYTETCRSSTFFEGWGRRRPRSDEIYRLTTPPYHNIDLQIKGIDPVLKADVLSTVFSSNQPSSQNEQHHLVEHYWKQNDSLIPNVKENTKEKQSFEANPSISRMGTLDVKFPSS